MSKTVRKIGLWAIVLALIASMILSLASCSGMSAREQRVLSGAAIGAGAGTVLSGASGGDPLTGAAVGAAAGVVGGLIVDQTKKKR